MCVCRVLCSTVKELVAKLAASSRDDDCESVSGKCSVLNQKLDALFKTLNSESQAAATATASQHTVQVTEELMLSSSSVFCLFVSRIVQKLLKLMFT